MSKTPSKHKYSLCTMRSLHVGLLTIVTIIVYYISKPQVTEMQQMNRLHLANGSDNNSTVSMIQLMSQNVSSNHSIQWTVISERTHVIVMSQKRSGSSFMGELFNQNPKVFFMFEPLQSLTTLAMKKTSFSFETAVQNTLNSILKCDLTHVPVSGWEVKKTEVSTCFNAFEMQNSSLLQQVCSKYGLTSNQMFLNISSTLCKRRSHFAFKTIRINDLAHLKRFFAKEEFNIKVIHLVRDPRAVMNSRHRLQEVNLDFIRRKGTHADEVKDLCQNMKRNIAYGQHTPDWLTDRYKLVRYEDLAENPFQVTVDIYNYLGWILPQEVNTWILRNTDHEDNNNAYSRTRDSRKTAQAWRKTMSFPDVLKIQNKCQDVMKLLGYVQLESRQSMSDSKLSCIEPFNGFYTDI